MHALSAHVFDSDCLIVMIGSDLFVAVVIHHGLYVDVCVCVCLAQEKSIVHT